MNCNLLSIIFLSAFGFGQLAGREFNEALLTSDSLTKSQLRQICGIPDDSQSRIIGGEDAKPGQYPWVVGINTEFANKQMKTCGGSLIDHEHILTAAHCLYNYDNVTDEWLKPTNVTVILGYVNEDSEENYANQQTYTAIRWESHEDYNDVPFNNDIALLKLNTRVEFSKWILPICLPKSCDRNHSSYVNEIVTVIGWGCLKFGGNSSNRLKHVNLTVFPDSACEKYFSHFHRTQICAGDKRGEKDSCQGDSGGPLMLKDSKGQVNVIGIVSYGDEFGRKGIPGGYTEVCRFIHWIFKKSKIM